MLYIRTGHSMSAAIKVSASRSKNGGDPHASTCLSFSNQSDSTKTRTTHTTSTLIMSYDAPASFKPGNMKVPHRDDLYHESCLGGPQAVQESRQEWTEGVRVLVRWMAHRFVFVFLLFV